MKATVPATNRSSRLPILIALLCLAAAGAARAQVPPPDPQAEARLVPIEQGDIKLMEQVLSVFRGSPLTYALIEDLNVIVLYGPASAVQSAEEIIRQLDRPARPVSEANVVFAVDILTNVKELGQPLASNATAVAEPVRKEFPTEIFSHGPYSHARGTAARSRAADSSPLGGDQPSTYQFKVDRVTIESAADKSVVRADGMIVARSCYLPEPKIDTPQPAEGQPVPAGPGSRSDQNRYNVGLRVKPHFRPGQPVLTSKQNLMPGQVLYFVVTARIEE